MWGRLVGGRAAGAVLDVLEAVIEPRQFTAEFLRLSPAVGQLPRQILDGGLLMGYHFLKPDKPGFIRLVHASNPSSLARQSSGRRAGRRVSRVT